MGIHRVLGRGSFGMVLLAEYRGTKVAVKHVLPPKRKEAKANNECCFSDEEAGDYTQSTSDMEGFMLQAGYLGGFSGRSSSRKRYGQSNRK